jgi:holo-[acyl-carrier protein] synthase
MKTKLSLKPPMMKPTMTKSSILGIGNDIIEIDRIRKNLQTHPERFLDKLFTKNEQTYCLKHQDPAPSLAGRFAAKEAIAKALGCGFGEKLSWLDLEILNDSQGKPILTCSPTLNTRFNNPRLLISLSHCKEYATAVAILVE